MDLSVRLLAFSQCRGLVALILEDKPGEPLEQLLNQPPIPAALSMQRSAEPAMELGLFLRLAVGLFPPETRRGDDHRIDHH